MAQEADVREKLLADLADICTAERSFTDQDKLFCFSVSGEHAEDVWFKLRENAKSGYWPVILGTEDDCEEQIYTATHPQELGFESSAAIIKKATEMDAKTWLETRFAENPSDYITDEQQPDTDLSPLNTIARKYQFYTLVDLQKEFHPEIHFALLPTAGGDGTWETPAHLFYGGWNLCPLPEEHVALFKYWSQLYGAEVFSMAGDVIEMHVNKPPKTREHALELAREQFIYCPDIVHQGTRTLHALADEILDSQGWFFWWD